MVGGSGLLTLCVRMNVCKIRFKASMNKTADNEKIFQLMSLM